MNAHLLKSILALTGGILIYSPTLYTYYQLQKTNKKINDIIEHVHDMKHINHIELSKY